MWDHPNFYLALKEDWDEFYKQKKLNATDRIRPIGKTSDFSLTWDGYNLIDTLSQPLAMTADKKERLNN